MDLNAELKTISLSPNQTLVAVGGRAVLSVVRIHGRVPKTTGRPKLTYSTDALDAFADAMDAGVYGGVGLKIERTVYTRTKTKKNLSLTCNAVAWHPRLQNILATGATNGAVVFWDLEESKSLKRKVDGKKLPSNVLSVSKVHDACVNAVAWHPHGDPNLLLSASVDKTVCLWDRRDAEEPKQKFDNLVKVNDVKFSTSSVYDFATGCGDGSIQLWDLRQPTVPREKVMAHGRHVNSIDWHPDRPNILASGGSDKTIKVWDMVSGRPFREMQALASVSQVQWHPTKPEQLASSCVEVDLSISVWDIRFPNVPKACFRGHVDAVPGIQWLPPDEMGGDAYVLSCSRDKTVRLHAFKDAICPAENARRRGISLSPTGDIAIVRSLGIVTSTLLHFEPERTALNTDTFRYLASHYKSRTSPPDIMSLFDVCNHNRQVAMAVRRPWLAQTWATVGIILGKEERLQSGKLRGTPGAPEDGGGVEDDVDDEGSDIHATDEEEERLSSAIEGNLSSSVVSHDFTGGNLSSVAGELPRLKPWLATDDEEDPYMADSQDDDDDTSSNDSSFNDGTFSLLIKQLDIANPVGRTEGHPSPDESDSPIQRPFDHAMQKHAEQDGENRLAGKETRTLFDRAMKKYSGKKGGILSPSKRTKAGRSLLSSSSLCVDIRADVLESLLNHYCDVQGDIQMCAILADMAIQCGIQIDEIRAQSWFHSYVDLLQRHGLHLVAAEFLSTLPGSAGRINQLSTTLYSFCTMCSRPLQPSQQGVCDKCHESPRCVLCEKKVKGVFTFCQGCGHGGHLDHILQWFETNNECPSGCGHRCKWNKVEQLSIPI